VQRRGAITLSSVATHQRTPRLLIERIEAKQLTAALNRLSEGTILFQRRDETTEHLARPLLEAFAIRLYPFVVAVRQQVPLVQGRGFLECPAIALESFVGSAFERHDVDYR
jgi:hypothetical protein